MATVDGRTPERIKDEIESERTELAHAVEELRSGLASGLRPKLPLLAGGAAGAGFVLAGGIGALARLALRRSREGEAKVGRFARVNRR
jgi:Protein of unknown function (DUF3618)